MKRTLFYLSFISVFGCVQHKKTPAEMILGTWIYITAERLGDGSQNDSLSITEFNKRMAGYTLRLYKDGTYKGTRNSNDKELPVLNGKYAISSDGKTMTMDNLTEKISLTDSIFKIYSPNNGSFVWHKKN